MYCIHVSHTVGRVIIFFYDIKKCNALVLAPNKKQNKTNLQRNRENIIFAAAVSNREETVSIFRSSSLLSLSLCLVEIALWSILVIHLLTLLDDIELGNKELSV